MPVILLVLFLIGAPLVQASANLEAINYSAPNQNHHEIILSFDQAAKFNVFMLTSPDRLVIDTLQARWALPETLKRALSRYPQILKVRHAQHVNKKGKHLRVVFDLSEPIVLKSSHKIQGQASEVRLAFKPTERISVVTLMQLDSIKRSGDDAYKTSGTLDTSDNGAVSIHNTLPADAQQASRTQQILSASHVRDIVIAIDPGHGGQDPGAIGAKGHREKDIVLQISRRLKQYVDDYPGMKAVLTRKDDYYVGLKKRQYLAKAEYKADLFISIHADAWKHRSAHGASVYVLSRRGASSTLAKYLADSENKSDEIAGIDLSQENQLLRSVLADLAVEGNMEHSFLVGEYVLKSLKSVTHLHKPQVEQAGFVVLKSLDIPSILVETGFISNLAEERQLSQKAHQDQIASALLEAIVDYFQAYPLPGTWLSTREIINP